MHRILWESQSRYEGRREAVKGGFLEEVMTKL